MVVPCQSTRQTLALFQAGSPGRLKPCHRASSMPHEVEASSLISVLSLARELRQHLFRRPHGMSCLCIWCVPYMKNSFSSANSRAYRRSSAAFHSNLFGRSGRIFGPISVCLSVRRGVIRDSPVGDRATQQCRYLCDACFGRALLYDTTNRDTEKYKKQGNTGCFCGLDFGSLALGTSGIVNSKPSSAETALLTWMDRRPSSTYLYYLTRTVLHLIFD